VSGPDVGSFGAADADEVGDFGEAAAVAGDEDLPVLPMFDGAFDRNSEGGDAVVPDLISGAGLCELASPEARARPTFSGQQS